MEFIAIDEHGARINDLTVKIDFDGGSNPIYVGEAKPGTATSESGWRIKRITWSDGNPTAVEWAGGDHSFTKEWDERGNYSYS